MAMGAVNKRALMEAEAAWLPRSLEEAANIRWALMSSGLPDQQVNGIVGWLVAKVAGQRDQTSAQTRSTYRKVLAGLDSPLTSPDNGAIPRYVNSPAGTPRAA